ncbi:MAG: polysaccharide pyruvyl transferase family protein, partial [Anaerostipes sp.]|nr:polysaccharide pyruvyl transferase family protein [Anaerostipes sp.]
KGNKEQILKWLLKYKYITVREDNAVDMLRDLGLKSERVLDPTLLVEKSMWFKYLLPIKEKGYVLVYQLHNDKRLGEYANKVAKLKGLPLIRISPTFHQISRQGKFVWLPEFGEFLSYIKNAECMITDSFHGTAFAITFNTPFIEVLPNNNTKGRNISILKLTGLESQLLDNFENFDLALKKVDFSYANKILSNERNNSYQLFKDIIRK